MGCAPGLVPPQLAMRCNLVSLAGMRASTDATRSTTPRTYLRISRTMTKKINSILIYGYGVMGRGVASTFAKHGFETTVRSSRAASLKDLPAGVRAVDNRLEIAPPPRTN